jgi:hypothetical protein
VTAAGVEGAESLTARLVRLRFNDDLAALAGFSLGVSGAAGAASSRARALVERRGSDMSCTGRDNGHHVINRDGWRVAPCICPTLPDAFRGDGTLACAARHSGHATCGRWDKLA